ncbi:MAG: Maf family protein [Heliobacteriaceae bacterium]|nr:Maf family protein [Heliobacteriaceae bacterium]
MQLVLASASPRRRGLLKDLGISFQVLPSAVAEDGFAGLAPADQACALARAKARSVCQGLNAGIVLGADTIVVLEREVLGKPETAAHAKVMLRCLSGRSHRVITGIALFRVKDGEIVDSLSGFEETKVFFRDLSAEDIDLYVATGDCLDKAGAYGIQGLAALLVQRIEGDYFNVVGLPLVLVDKLLRQWGYSLLQEGARSGFRDD